MPFNRQVGHPQLDSLKEEGGGGRRTEDATGRPKLSLGRLSPVSAFKYYPYSLLALLHFGGTYNVDSSVLFLCPRIFLPPTPTVKGPPCAH